MNMLYAIVGRHLIEIDCDVDGMKISKADAALCLCGPDTSALEVWSGYCSEQVQYQAKVVCGHCDRSVWAQFGEEPRPCDGCLKHAPTLLMKSNRDGEAWCWLCRMTMAECDECHDWTPTDKLIAHDTPDGDGQQLCIACHDRVTTEDEPDKEGER